MIVVVRRRENSGGRFVHAAGPRGRVRPDRLTPVDWRSIGLVGCGRWGVNILRDLVALDANVAVVARSEASRERAREGGALVIAREIDELPDVDGVVVATTTTTHVEVVEQLLDRGVPI